MRLTKAIPMLGLSIMIGMSPAWAAGAQSAPEASSAGGTHYGAALKQDLKQLGADVADGTRHAGHVIANGAASLGHSVVKGGKKAGRAVKHGAHAAGQYVEQGAHKAKEALTPTQTPPAPIESGSQQR